jgi:Tfp pilus assembly protein PilE
MDLMFIPILAVLLLTAYLIYRGYVARARGRKTPDQES